MSGLNWPGLLEKARQMAQTASRLQAGLTPGLPERFVTAVEQMAQRSRKFVEMVDLPEPPDLRDRVLRHDLRAHLALVIGFSELWQRPVAAHKVEAFLPTLAELLASAKEVLARLDALVAALGGTATTTAPPPLPFPTPPLLPFQMSRESGLILVVDDNRENRELLQILLEQLGHRVVVAGSGPEALSLLAKDHFDLVLLDVMMPEMDGFAVLDRIKADDALRHIPVLMVSALDRLDSVVAGIARGAEDYLTRPFNELLLRARVGACLEKKRLRDREMEHQRQIDRLLHSIFPPEVVEELTQQGAIQPRRHEKVGVCFVDVVGFTSFCDRHAGRPEEVVRLLEWYVEAFEAVAARHRVQKIKTIGDAFLMVSGLLRPMDNPVMQLVRCAAELLEEVREGPAGWQVRVGIHVGPVVAGTLGEFQYSFDLWGSTVNIAARLESMGRPGVITLSDDAWTDVKEHCVGWPRDAAIRGIGAMTVWDFAGFSLGRSQ